MVLPGVVCLALLLCSLLLGFGLDAYVAVGTTYADDRQTTAAADHAWVIVFGGGVERKEDAGVTVTAIEPTTGQRSVLFPRVDAEVENASRYATLACVFNHESFFANAQPSDRIADCSFDLKHVSSWLPVDKTQIATLRAAAPASGGAAALSRAGPAR